MKIKNIVIKSLKCFKDLFIDCLDENSKPYQWTVLLGNNNSGKTSILKAIANLSAKELPTIERGKLNMADADSKKFVPSVFFRSNEKLELSSDSYVGCSISGIEDPNYVWRYNDKIVSLADEKIKDFQIYGYGVSRYPSSAKLQDSTCEPCDTLFESDKKLINIEEWLMQLDYAAKNEQVKASTRLNKIQKILYGELFPEIYDFKVESTDELHTYVKFKTKDGWFRYTQLGYGYQSMLSWVIDLCKRMFERYPDSENPLNENAIVLVDEIDLHLHPEWQRKVIPFLSKNFPNVQFIVTTHSPLVIQSMENINLYVLHRNEDTVIAERFPRNDFRGWTVEEILRDVMHLEDDVHTDYYQKHYTSFENALDERDKDEAIKAFNALEKLLHPNNPLRRILEIQINQLKRND